MAMELREADSLLAQLGIVNAQLLSLGAADLAELGQAIGLRAQLLARAGTVLRTVANRSQLTAYRDALEQAVDVGDVAVSQLLSMRQTLSSEYHRVVRIQSDEPASEPELTCQM